jgi:hypothetical protein
MNDRDNRVHYADAPMPLVCRVVLRDCALLRWTYSRYQPNFGAGKPKPSSDMNLSRSTKVSGSRRNTHQPAKAAINSKPVLRMLPKKKNNDREADRVISSLTWPNA